MAMKVNVGDVVKVVMSNSDMDAENNYQGSATKDTVGVVTQMHPLFPSEFNLDDELGAPNWMRPSWVEVLERTEFTKADLKEGQVWVALEDRTYFTKGHTYKVAPTEGIGDCQHGFIDNDGDENYNPSHYPPMHLLTDVVVADVAEEVEDNAFELDTGLTPFGELDSSKKAMLLLDHHEGKTIQTWLTGAGKWFDNDTPTFYPDVIYRTKPQALIDAENAIAASEARTTELKDELERLSASL